MEEGEEVAGGFVVAGRDAAALFESREQTLDVVAFAIELLVIRPLDFAIALGRNHGLSAAGVDRLQHLVAVVAFVGDDVPRRESLQQRRSLSDVVRLSRRQQKLDGVAEPIASGMNFRSESAA